jgi:hypothetical protein
MNKIKQGYLVHEKGVQYTNLLIGITNTNRNFCKQVLLTKSPDTYTTNETATCKTGYILKYNKSWKSNLIHSYNRLIQLIPC